MREGEVSAWCRRMCESKAPTGCRGRAKARFSLDGPDVRGQDTRSPSAVGFRAQVFGHWAASGFGFRPSAHPGCKFRPLGCFWMRASTIGASWVRISAIHAPRAPSRVRFTAIGASRARVFGHWAASGVGFRPSTHPGFGICPSRGENRLWMDGSRTLVGQTDKIRTRISRRGCGHFLRQSYTAYPSASRCSSGAGQPSAWEMRPERNQRIPGHIPGSFSGHRRDSDARFVRRAASGFGFRPSTRFGCGFRTSTHPRFHPRFGFRPSAHPGFGFRPLAHPGFGICPSRGENRLWMDGCRTLVEQMDKKRTQV